MINYIGLNIKYLCDKNKLSQKEFGEIFEQKQATINTYINGRSNPNVETIQKICKHFGITIDDFINLDLTLKGFTTTNNDKQRVLAEPPPPDYGTAKYVKQLEDMVQLQKEFIEAQKLQIENLKAQPGAAS
ncbi:helix-turn-helix domain-containing protein [Flavobacterium sp. Sd200]|uniref:helix-turn-helix transcriptional regulator n=1 Tax=Flavobacterium sp. Sd200 TaxID=2692211 RepID=UPI00136F37C4|nr:helix-turn-helix transcriptional regulator [Flavobacterium sp. Sd200]MXN90189.1 helix-turn-helix domain-containing protein [Flavobacterium sp. Sd200]